MEEHEERDEVAELLQDMDQSDIDHIQKAMNDLIDPISKWVNLNKESTLTDEDLVDLLESLAYAKFIIQGIMYTYGVGVECDHEDEEEDDDES